MSVNATSYINSGLLTDSDGSSRVPAKILTQDDFLKLLVTQMTSQDPLNPKTDTDMAAQMAQFSALEQSSGMASSLSSLLAQQQILQANGLLGRTVELQLDSQTSLLGTVDAVQIESGTPKVVVNGVSYDLSQVRTITPAAAPAT